MPRLDAARCAPGATCNRSSLRSNVASTRTCAEWAVPLGWFDVLAALRELDGRARPQDVASVMRIPASSLSRGSTGWRRRAGSAAIVTSIPTITARSRSSSPARRRTVAEMNVSYRRSLQARFAVALTDRDIQALTAPNGSRHRGCCRPRRRARTIERCLTPPSTAVRRPGISRRTSPRSPWRSGRGCRAASTSTSVSARRCRAATPRPAG